MEHDVWRIARHHLVEQQRILRVADDRHDRLIGEALAQFLDEAVHRVFGQIERDQLRRCEAEDLPAQLGADRTAGASDHHDAAAQQRFDVRRVDRYCFATQQVFEIDIAHLGQETLPRHQRSQRRQHHRLHARAHAQRRHASLRFDGRRRNRDDRVFDLHRFGPVLQVVERAEHLVAVDFAALLRHVVVEQADEPPFAGTGQLAREIRSRRAGAEHEHGLALADEAAVQVELLRRAIERACAAHREEQHQWRNEQHRARDDRRRLEHHGADHHDHGAADDCLRDAHQVGQAREHPQAPVEAEDVEHQGVDGQGPSQCGQRTAQEIRRDAAIKADQISAQPRGDNRRQVEKESTQRQP